MASRVRIIDDTFTLAEGGYVPYEVKNDENFLNNFQI